MINKDYILRLAEQIGRSLAIILGLRKYNQQEEALIYIDNVLLKTTGMTSRFINSLSEEMLLQIFSPMGILNVEACLWTATLLKAEGEIYAEMGKSDESYYRSVKALHLFLAALRHEHVADDSELHGYVRDLLKKLDDFELPASTKQLLIGYYEYLGHYAKAEDVLFELLDDGEGDSEIDHAALIDQGKQFYTRLQNKSVADLAAGNMSREEIEDGLQQMRLREQ